MKLIYGIEDKPKFSKTLVFAFQQMIAIMAATLLVPLLVTSYGLQADAAAALFGAGIGTIVYLFCTKRRSPVFLGSSFTFLGAYAATIGQNYGYWGMLIGVAFAGLVYVIIGLVIKVVGSGWVNKLMPSVIIGPIVALIGLSLSGTATSWIMGNGAAAVVYGETYNWAAIICGIFTFFMIVIASVKGSKTVKLIPFIVGIGAGYALALVFTIIGMATGTESLKLLSFQPFIDAFGTFSITSIVDYPKFFFLKAIETNGQYPLDAAAIGNIAMIYIPIGVVELAQHIADHKNLSTVVNRDLIADPGLDKTLIGDGLGSIVGAFFGGCANPPTASPSAASPSPATLPSFPSSPRHSAAWCFPSSLRSSCSLTPFRSASWAARASRSTASSPFPVSRCSTVLISATVRICSSSAPSSSAASAVCTSASARTASPAALC